jgi:hypothetical protein
MELEGVMEKTEMMKRYEAETGREAVDYLTEYPFDEYTRWLEAEAYDRLMSGKSEPKEENRYLKQQSGPESFADDSSDLGIPF